MISSYRREEKYLCSQKQLEHLNFLLDKILPKDQNVISDSYHISSLYFDTESDRFFRETLDGVAIRRKYRIRKYNNSNKNMKFESKETLFDRKKKQFILISEDEVHRILKGEKIDNSELFLQFFIINKTENLIPKITISYDRIAFTFSELDIRITLDRNIAVSVGTDPFFTSSVDMKNMLQDQSGILEIKYTSFFPPYLRQILDLRNLERTSFSKYAIGRMTVNPYFNNLR